MARLLLGSVKRQYQVHVSEDDTHRWIKLGRARLHQKQTLLLVSKCGWTCGGPMLMTRWR
jgi:hypothetical protein